MVSEATVTSNQESMGSDSIKSDPIDTSISSYGLLPKEAIPMKRLKITILLSALALVLTGCSCTVDTGAKALADQLKQAIESFDRAITSLNAQSSDWQIVLQDLEKELAADTQSTLRTEVTNLGRAGVLTTGGEVRCNSDFLRKRLAKDLRQIRNEMAELINKTNYWFQDDIPLLPEIPTEPAICNAVPTAIDLTLDETRRMTLEIYGMDLRSLPITAELVNQAGERDVTEHLGIISDTQMVLNLSDTGAKLMPDNTLRNITLRWKGQKQSVIPITSVPSSENNCRIEVINKTFDNPTEYYIPPFIQGGDADFDGDGPCVVYTLTHAFEEDQTKLVAHIKMQAYECDDDFNTPIHNGAQVLGETPVTLMIAGVGEKILAVDRLTPWDFSYIDQDHSNDIFSFTGAAPVDKLEFVGDTSGDEAGTKTGVKTYFSKTAVTIKKCKVVP